VPIQEAVVQLEHDGILSTQYHRGAYVERFDESVVRNTTSCMDWLTGIASARAAADRPSAILDQLGTSSTRCAVAKSRAHFRRRHGSSAPDQRRVRGPRLQAAIRASQTFIPQGSGCPTSTTTTRCCRPSRPKPQPSTVATPMVPARRAPSGPR